MVKFYPKAVLDLPKHGCINIHASLLPKYRGGAPIHHAVMRGEAVTGVTIMYMAVGLDTGDMISSVELPIEDTDTTGILFEKLSIAGADLLKRTLPDLLAGRTRLWLKTRPMRFIRLIFAGKMSSWIGHVLLSSCGITLGA